MVHATWMVVTSLVPTVPLPPVRPHVCQGFVGCAVTLAEYVEPDATLVGKVNVVWLAATVMVSAPFFSCRPPPARPLTVPPTLKLPPVVPPGSVQSWPKQMPTTGCNSMPFAEPPVCPCGSSKKPTPTSEITSGGLNDVWQVVAPLKVARAAPICAFQGVP